MKAESDNIQNLSDDHPPPLPPVSVEEWLTTFWVFLPNIDSRWSLYNCGGGKAADSKPDLSSQVRLLDEKLQLQHCRVCRIGANAERVAEGHAKD